jgi:acetyl-CoA C-acetyltransferase
MTETDGTADTVEAVTSPSTALDDVFTSEDMVEGVTAFMGKRPPRWKNR